VTTRRLGVARAVVDGRLVAGDIAVTGAVVSEVGLSPAGRGIAAPGLIDLQVNGYGGIDLLGASTDAEWLELGSRLLQIGVTAYQPTLITSAPAVTRAALQRAGRVIGRPAGARIVGVHLEGPFISAQRLGAHPPEHRLDPDPAMLDELLDAGPVTMLTLAPELPGALELIGSAATRGVVVSLGHCAAGADQIDRAIAAGARSVTHVFNAMPPVSGRAPGLAGLALTRDRLSVMCIADGVHLADDTLRLLLACAAPRLVLTSDCVAAAGTDADRAMLGSGEVTVAGRRVTRPDGTLSGSIGTVPQALARLIELGASPELAINAATRNPAALLGRTDIGNLRPGARADVVVLDGHGGPLRVVQVLHDGRPVSAG
jgi:N-acetylglucosamine-6-phosphate deacetylase